MKQPSPTYPLVHASNVDFEPLLRLWPKSVNGSVLPIGATAFGDLFFQRPEGHVEKLDVLHGGVHHAASSLDEFGLLMGSRYWRDANLMCHGIDFARKKGLVRNHGQFFGFVRHPAKSGRIDWSALTCLEAKVWHTICAKALDKLCGPERTKAAPVRRSE